MIRVYVKEFPNNLNEAYSLKKLRENFEQYQRKFKKRYSLRTIFENATIYKSGPLKGKHEHYFENNTIDIRFTSFVMSYGYTTIGIKIFKTSDPFFRKKWFTLKKFEDIFTINQEILQHLKNLRIIDFQIGGPFHQVDFDCILVEHIMDVPVEEVMRMSIREEKLEGVRKWVNKKNLLNPKKQYSWPDLGRSMDSKLRFKEYEIGDGIHRIERARELGLSHIKAIVGDVIHINFSFREDIKLPSRLLK